MSPPIPSVDPAGLEIRPVRIAHPKRPGGVNEVSARPRQSARYVVDRLLGDREAFLGRANLSHVLRDRLTPSDVLTWEELDLVLNYTGVQCNMVKSGARVGGALKGQVVQLLHDGATLQMELVERFSPRLAEIAGELSVALGGDPVDVNIYCAPSKKHESFPVHHDVVNVFVLQLAGHKRWQIYRPEIENPNPHMKDHSYSLDENDPLLDVILNPGDVLYVRRGDPHKACCASEEPSLQVTLRVHPMTRTVFLQWLVQEAADQPRFRTSLPFALGEDDLTKQRVDWAEDLIGEFTTWIGEWDPAELMNRFLNEATVNPLPGLAAVPDILRSNADPLGQSTPVMLAHPLLRARVVGERLFAGGYEVRLPSGCAPAIRTVISHPTHAWSANELGHVHGLTPTDQLVEVFSQLINLSILRIEESAKGRMQDTSRLGFRSARAPALLRHGRLNDSLS